jgi:tetratricopeptide (TPR) repeat protein
VRCGNRGWKVAARLPARLDLRRRMGKRPERLNKLLRRESKQSPWPVPPAGPRLWFVAVFFALTIGATYFSALHSPFIFDDRSAIVGNESIAQLWPLIGHDGRLGPLNPGPNLPTSSRPLVNLSLALNYCFGGANPFGYHVYSVVLHFLTTMLLWDLVRRTLRLPYFERRFELSAGWLALAVATLWALHPLATETVIYATQRSELMMAFFYLAALDCSMRYWDTFPLPVEEGARASSAAFSVVSKPGSSDESINIRRRSLWLTLAILSCLAGMASKEVMVSAPVMILLFERTFIAGSLAKALRRSWPLYVGLAATWILPLVVSLGAPYGTSAGFAAGVPALNWWLTQAEVFLMYLKLAFWPWPLLIHYELPYLTTFGQSWMFILPVMVLASITLLLLWRNHPAGYLGTAIFAILAPTSLIPIPLEMAAERRMYLPLAALLILVIVGGYQLVQKAARGATSGDKATPASVWIAASAVVAIAALTCFGASTKRLASYKSEMVLWQEVLQRQPNNVIAHNNLGLILTTAGRIPESIGELQAALAIKPDYLYALINLGNAFSLANQLPQAVDAFQSAVRVDPHCFPAYNCLGIALMRAGRFEDAVGPLKRALRLRPDNSDVHVNLGSAFVSIGRVDDSIREFEAALAVAPENVPALVNSSVSLAKTGRTPEAIENLRHALRLQPNNADAHTNLGIYLPTVGKSVEAMEHFQAVLKQNPNDANVRFHYADLLTNLGRASEAIPHLQQVVAMRPDFADAFFNLAQAYRLTDRHQDAEAAAQHAIELSNANNQPEAAAQIREWLKQYETTLLQKSGRGSD